MKEEEPKREMENLMNKDKRLIQGTPEWLEFRRHGVFASDVPVIMGVSPWKTPLQLYWEKITGNAPVKTGAMERGTRMEAEARECFERVTGHFVEPKVILNPHSDWMGASLDGINDHGILVEIKCPGKADHEMAIEGIIPLKYYPQLQFQMYVCMIPEMYYFSYLPDHAEPWVIIKVHQSPAYVRQMMPKVHDFYDCLVSRTPPAPSDKEKLKSDIGSPKIIVNHADLIVEENLAYLKTQLEKSKLVVKALQEEFDELENHLISNFENCPHVGETLIFTPTVRKGLIDYSAIPMLKSIDLEPYRKPPIKGWKIEFIE